MDRYIGPSEFHDGYVREVRKVEPSTMEVLVEGSDGGRYVVRFSGVQHVHAVAPQDMMLYALRELPVPGGLKEYVFVNWDEAGSAALAITAASVAIGRLP